MCWKSYCIVLNEVLSLCKPCSGRHVNGRLFSDVLWLSCLVVLSRLCFVKVTKQLWTSTSQISPTSGLWQRQSEIFDISVDTQTPPAGCDSWERRYSTAQMETVPTYRMLPFSLLTVSRPVKSSNYLARWPPLKVSAFALSASESPIRLVRGICVSVCCRLANYVTNYESTNNPPGAIDRRSLFKYFLSTIVLRKKTTRSIVTDRIIESHVGTPSYFADCSWNTILVFSRACAKLKCVVYV